MKTLRDVIARRPAKSVADVIQILTDADQVLADDDGLKWFNQLYLSVTIAVRDSLAQETFNDGPWLSQLDVVFANLHGVRSWLRARIRVWRRFNSPWPA
jgi:hypothetical protein